MSPLKALFISATMFPVSKIIFEYFLGFSISLLELHFSSYLLSTSPLKLSLH
jgi:hydrogenase/urease accessory protein HupE